MPALATVADLEAVTGLEVSAGADTDRAERLLTMASAVVERWTGRAFHRAEDDEIEVTVTDGTMRLPNGPTEAITSIVDGDGETVDDTTYDEIHGYVVRSYGWWACGTYTVTYTHGYDPIPDDVVLAVCQVVSRHLVNPDGIRSESIGEAATVYAIPGSGYSLGLTLSPVDEALLAPYRRQVATVRVL